MIEFSTKNKSYKYVIIRVSNINTFFDNNRISNDIKFLRTSKSRLLFVATNDTYRMIDNSTKTIRLRDKLERDINLKNSLIYEIYDDLTSFFDVITDLKIIEIFDEIREINFGDKYIYVRIH